MSSQTQNKINDLIMGKTLGRLGCGGSLHYDEAHHKEWEHPVTLKLQVANDEPIEIQVTGFDLRRDQGQNFTTRITLVAVEA